MARRGEQLREHILFTAKRVFLELGFERASMDEVAAQAATSKRSLYAHYESKEKLFLAVVELVRELFLSKLKVPEDYAAKPVEAVTLFCARYLEILFYEPSIQMCRVYMAEAVRFPEAAAEHHDVMFTEVQARLGGYVRKAWGLTPRAATEAAQRLLGQLLFPRFPRALAGLEPLAKSFDHGKLGADFDLKPVRRIVTEWAAGLDGK